MFPQGNEATNNMLQILFMAMNSSMFEQEQSKDNASKNKEEISNRNQETLPIDLSPENKQQEIDQLQEKAEINESIPENSTEKEIS